ncbi:uncharacterized protein LOC126368707 isoform X2 [Pectinophora gossypiella]|uniref:uncharacterized protein LOC126368707 isoform X2 n=1 Tax=Pectinophora gossypiella TaxID=13191 RepID=UPI00214F15E6|nr:uncharacterized protein LOC126368707 isoform X2 [Pectinophora gossypiella]
MMKWKIHLSTDAENFTTLSMVEGPTQTKNDEQFPLLMVAGAGDGTVRAPPSTVPSLWNSTCTVPPRRPWSDRWPEYLSTCWMTFILLGISFLVFYAIGMVMVYKHDAYIFVKCNDTKPATDVFCHSLVPRGTIVPLAAYSAYLANVAVRYPNLRFNIYFLIDDSGQYQAAKRNIYNKLYPYDNFYDESVAIFNRREIREFQRKHPNVNITIMLLSKYMATTPLKYKWRSIPVSYLPFYVRVFSVWLSGGVGLDLATYNELYLTGHDRSNRRTNAILKQHNDGITAEKYIETLNKIESDVQTEFVSTFFTMVQKMFNETLSIFNKTFALPFAAENTVSVPSEKNAIANEPLIRTHRNKRDVGLSDNTTSAANNNTVEPAVVNIVLANTTVVNVTGDSNKKNVYQMSSNEVNVATANETTATNAIPNVTESGWHVHMFSNESYGDDLIKLLKKPDKDAGADKNKTEWPQIVFFYDFSVVSETVPPEIEGQRLTSYEHGVSPRSVANPSKFVTIEAEGSFVAATTRLHPFLASVMSGGCKRMAPDLAIQNALLTQCSGALRDESYCSGIYII